MQLRVPTHDAIVVGSGISGGWAAKELTERGLSVLLLEQNVGQALRIADRAYVMRSGRIILEETADQMRQRSDYWDLF